ncbi:MAG TPA: hypothetical protein VJS63_11960 [Bradyrhizobium sp.]|nr:hypothetical protein [Bradyrhizobium sp.]
MADTMRAAFLQSDCRPSINHRERRNMTMVELFYVAQMFRNPLEALARRWYCRGLFRATRGARRCAECTKS